ncbi:MAG: ceramidase [Clostridiales bacterium]|nr:ceramidase [Clostridiales bacterium]
MGFAYIIWQLDNFLPFSLERGTFFEQTGFFQGHSFWHLLGATACGVIYLHYSRTYKAANPELAEAKANKETVTV